MQVVLDNADLMWIGLKLTLKLSIVIIVLSTLVGTFVGIGLVYGNCVVRSVLRLYVDIIRGIPLLVLIFLIFYGLPALHISILGRTVNTNIGRFETATLAFTLFAAAHVGEIVRGALAAVPARPDRCGQGYRAHVLAPPAPRPPAPVDPGDPAALDEHRRRAGQGNVAGHARQHERPDVRDPQDRRAHRRGGPALCGGGGHLLRHLLFDFPRRCLGQRAIPLSAWRGDRGMSMSSTTAGQSGDTEPGNGHRSPACTSFSAICTFCGVSISISRRARSSA